MNNIFSDNNLLETCKNSTESCVKLSETSISDSITDLQTKKKASNSCMFCKKKSLMLYQCKCGQDYCVHHKNAEHHECTFDYKKFQREIIAKNNPVVAAEKIKKIY